MFYDISFHIASLFRNGFGVHMHFFLRLIRFSKNNNNKKDENINVKNKNRFEE